MQSRGAFVNIKGICANIWIVTISQLGGEFFKHLDYDY
jgi:hypothetical protein